MTAVEAGTGSNVFLSTPSARRATSRGSGCCKNYSDFYPRPPRGGRLRQPPQMSQSEDFYPRPPRGGRLDIFLAKSYFFGISIHALREEGDFEDFRKYATRLQISIHALREEGDTAVRPSCSRSCYFYPRPPRGGRPAKGQLLEKQITNFYPRPPRGGRLLRPSRR